ncbi:MAG: coproporphyrinogen-III oxidase family protein, partial [Myxococcota bacterium]
MSAKKCIPHESYADQLIAEFDARRHELEGRWVPTLYFGGGTPSLLAVEQLRRVVRHCWRGELEEVTIEANPADIDARRLDAWADMGITRVSLGVQSFQGRMLRALGRNHDAQRAWGAARTLSEDGRFRTSIDLIFGGPHHTLEEWEADLDCVAALEGLEHVSTYTLTVEPNTPFFRLHERGQLHPAREDVAARMFDVMEERLGALGFERYEVSSFARGERARSMHNTTYWLGAEYMGLGVGAHSLFIGAGGVERRVNTRHVSAYLGDFTLGSAVEELGAE